jgi:AcrR family transcriptional regulator
VATKAVAVPEARIPPRERLLAAASELFYEEGVHTVGIDRIIERAGVAKASLYSAFGSKDELVRCYLQDRQAVRTERIERRVQGVDDPRERILVVFDYLHEQAEQPGFRGCAFYNASAESPPGGVIEQVTDEVREWTRALFHRLSTDAGATEPDTLAERLMVLYDGATAGARLDRDPEATTVARTMAATLIDAAIARP